MADAIPPMLFIIALALWFCVGFLSDIASQLRRANDRLEYQDEQEEEKCISLMK